MLVFVCYCLPSLFCACSASSVVTDSYSPSPTSTTYRRRRRDRQRSQLIEQESITQELKARFGQGLTSPSQGVTPVRDDATSNVIVTHEPVISPSSLRDRADYTVTSPRRVGLRSPRDVTSAYQTNTNSNNVATLSGSSSASSSRSNYVIGSSAHGSMNGALTNGHASSSSEHLQLEPQLGVISMFSNSQSYGADEGGHSRFTTRRYYPASPQQHSDSHLQPRTVTSAPALAHAVRQVHSEPATQYDERVPDPRAVWMDSESPLPPSDVTLPPSAHADSTSQLSMTSSDSDAVVWHDALSATSLERELASQPTETTISEFESVRTPSEAGVGEPLQTTSEQALVEGEGDGLPLDGEKTRTDSIHINHTHTHVHVPVDVAL